MKRWRTVAVILIVVASALARPCLAATNGTSSQALQVYSDGACTSPLVNLTLTDGCSSANGVSYGSQTDCSKVRTCLGKLHSDTATIGNFLECVLAPGFFSIKAVSYLQDGFVNVSIRFSCASSPIYEYLLPAVQDVCALYNTSSTSPCLSSYLPSSPSTPSTSSGTTAEPISSTTSTEAPPGGSSALAASSPAPSPLSAAVLFLLFDYLHDYLLRV